MPAAKGMEAAPGLTPLQALLGVEISSDADETVLRFTVREPFCNRRGILHGGIICVLFDTAMGTHMRINGGSGATMEIKTQYFHPVGQGEVTCRARYLKRGRQISFLSADLWDGEKICAAATATWLRLEQPAHE